MIGFFFVLVESSAPRGLVLVTHRRSTKIRSHHSRGDIHHHHHTYRDNDHSWRLHACPAGWRSHLRVLVSEDTGPYVRHPEGERPLVRRLPGLRRLLNRDKTQRERTKKTPIMSTTKSILEEKTTTTFFCVRRRSYPGIICYGPQA